MTSMTDDQVRDLAQEIAQLTSDNRGDNAPKKSSMDRTISVSVGILAIASFIFSVGINFSRRGSLEERIVKNEAQILDLTKQLQDSRSQNAEQRSQLLDRLSGIAADVAEIKGRLNAR